MKFSHLEISNWRQFSSVKITFHPRITIITGANGAGKSTILRILSQHFGWTLPLLSTPRITSNGAMKYFAGFTNSWLVSKIDSPQSAKVGFIAYSNGNESTLTVPENGQATYNLEFPNMLHVDGLLIGSHRPIPAHKKVENIPTNPMGAQQAYLAYFNETRNHYQGGHTGYSPLYRMKENLIGMATFGPGNEYVQGNEIVKKLFYDFKEILSKILPDSIGFQEISIRIPDVVIVTKTGDFVIDAASGGLMSLIDTAWQIFLFSHDKEEFTVILDEPENHLHPSMQRSLVRKLLEAFPKAQFILATHSPFIVSSVKDSSVYVLKYDDVALEFQTEISKMVHSVKLDQVNKAGTASEILRDVLGVPVTLPEWAEEELSAITNTFNIDQLNAESLKSLQQQLKEAGLSDYYPEAVKFISEGK